ncbi:MAG TPA: hypothetical protein VKE74_04530 [Gemmataceae bacterium]|nr:hypothetical protein [Gemmataceae bacterium]
MRGRLLVLVLLLAATGCRGVALVRGTEVVPGEASHRDDRPPIWAVRR